MNGKSAEKTNKRQGVDESSSAKINKLIIEKNKLKEVNAKQATEIKNLENNLISEKLKSYILSKKLKNTGANEIMNPEDELVGKRLYDIIKGRKIYGIKYNDILFSVSGKQRFNIFLGGDEGKEGINIKVKNNDFDETEHIISNEKGQNKYRNYGAELEADNNLDIIDDLIEGKTIQLDYGYSFCYAKKEKKQDHHNIKILDSTGETVLVIDNNRHFIYLPDNIVVDGNGKFSYCERMFY